MQLEEEGRRLFVNHPQEEVDVLVEILTIEGVGIGFDAVVVTLLLTRIGIVLKSFLFWVGMTLSRKVIYRLGWLFHLILELVEALIRAFKRLHIEILLLVYKRSALNSHQL